MPRSAERFGRRSWSAWLFDGGPKGLENRAQALAWVVAPPVDGSPIRAGDTVLESANLGPRQRTLSKMLSSKKNTEAFCNGVTFVLTKVMYLVDRKSSHLLPLQGRRCGGTPPRLKPGLSSRGPSDRQTVHMKKPEMSEGRHVASGPPRKLSAIPIGWLQ